MSHTDQSEYRLKMLEAIHQTAVDAIITIDERGIIDSVNPATETMFGYAPEEMQGQNINMLMPNPFRREHDGYLANYLTSGIPKIIGIGREVTGQRKDGSTFPIYLAVSELNVGDRRLFTGIVRDLTRFKQLEEQHATLGRIIEDSVNEVYIFDTDSLKFIQVNRGGRENLGYSLQELKEMSPVDIKPEFKEDEFYELIKPLLTGETDKLQFETIHLRKDHSTYEVDVHLQLSTYLNKPVFVAIILDVTERQRTQRLVQVQQREMQNELERLVSTRTEELKQAQADLVLSEKYSTLGKVSGGIAHEIRNPLNAVKTSAYYLLNAQDPTPVKVKEHLERIDRQVSLIDNVVTALSDVAKLPEAELVPVRLFPVVRAAVNAISLPADIEVRYEFSDELPHVMVDESQILIALKNLLRNARDAMPEGGTITIHAGLVDDSVVVSVSDCGVGIPPENLERILDPLFTTKARGMGLGLSITRTIVEKNAGTLVVESEPGSGSRFSIHLRRD